MDTPCVCYLLLVILVFLFIFKEDLMDGVIWIANSFSGFNDSSVSVAPKKPSKPQQDPVERFLQVAGVKDKRQPESIVVLDQFDNGPANPEKYSANLVDLVLTPEEVNQHVSNVNQYAAVSSGVSKLSVMDHRNDDNSWTFAGARNMIDYSRPVDPQSRTVPTKVGPEQSPLYKGLGRVN